MFVGDDGTFRVVEFTAVNDQGLLDPLQRLVDGDIELVRAPVALPVAGTARVDAWVNENGWRRSDLKHNAHIVALLSWPVFLVGPAVVTVTDDGGNTRGLPEPLIVAARGTLVESGAVELPDADVEEAAAQQQTVRQKRPQRV